LLHPSAIRKTDMVDFSCATNALLRLPLRVESPARPINAVSAARPSGIKEELQHVNLVVI
jgi:hypothetical protein